MGQRQHENIVNEGNPGYRWPEIRIARLVDPTIEDAEHGWLTSEFQNNLGRMNRGKGVARSMGSMACTYISATEMGRMLEQKYEKVFKDRGKTVQLMRRVKRQCDQFLHDRTRSVTPIDPNTEGLRVFGHNKLGFDLAGEEYITEEREVLISFLREDGLNTRHIGRKFGPHVTAYESFGPISAVVLKTTIDTPEQIRLEGLKSEVNTN